MNASHRMRRGFAMVVVLLVSMVALTAVVAAASVAALGSRQVTAIERRSTVALFAAESGLNALLARSRTPEYAFDEDTHASIQAWLEGVGLTSYELPGGATVELSAFPVGGGVVTIRSVGVAPDGSRRTVLQDFVREEALVPLDLSDPTGYKTKPPLKTDSAKSNLNGLGFSEAEWRFENRLLSSARIGDYVELDSVLYRVSEISGGNVTMYEVDNVAVERVEPFSTSATLIPFAVSESLAGDFFDGMTLSVTTTAPYVVGRMIEVGDGRAEITGISAEDGTLTVEWETIPSLLSEGDPIRRLIPSAISEGGCPVPKNAADEQKLLEKLPEGCVEQDLGNLFANTFGGISKTDLWEYAQAEGTCCDWPDKGTLVSGLTWIDGASTGDANSQPICGEGIVVLNTGAAPLEDPGAININVNGVDCQFRGLIYVIGQLGLQGNLDTFSGAIFIEGSDEVIVDPDSISSVQGGGDKSLYDPIAIRDALLSLPPSTTTSGIVGELPLSWRFGE